MPASNKVTRNTGGSAFPQTEYFDERPIGCMDGMSLRDYFAAHALPAVYAHAMVVGCESQDTIVAEAYELADSMLEERAK